MKTFSYISADTCVKMLMQGKCNELSLRTKENVAKILKFLTKWYQRGKAVLIR